MKSKSKQSKQHIAGASPLSLRNVLSDTAVIKATVEQAADEMTSVNEVLQLNLKVDLPMETIKKAISVNSNVEDKIAKAAEDLEQVNSDLKKELADRAGVESVLADTKSDLDEARKDIAILRAKEEQASKDLHQDPLTDILNRSGFDQSFKHGLIQAKRHDWKLAVMFIDIDKFKSINDTHGHDAGDKVLQMVASRLKMAFRAEDTVSRWGGDEFICLLLEVKHQDDVVRLAEVLISRLAETFSCKGVELCVKASIGIAVYPEDGLTAEALFKNADKAMYQAKGMPNGVALQARVTTPEMLATKM